MSRTNTAIWDQQISAVGSSETLSPKYEPFEFSEGNQRDQRYIVSLLALEHVHSKGITGKSTRLAIIERGCYKGHESLHGIKTMWKVTVDDQQKIITNLEDTLDKDELSQYVLSEVEPVDRAFSEGGAYGSVSLVRVSGGVECIEKRLHDILIGYGRNESVDPEQKESISKKFRDECVLLSQMHHPNIVQFMGVRYNRENRLSLIMEYLPMNVDKCIRRCNTEHFKLPSCFKLSILRDVADGLLYLHNHSMVHRDLSVANVLLTSDLRAKIADLGMSRILTPAEMKKLTKAAGAWHIMPPEALEEDNYKIDIFSFGVLSLYLILQEDPVTSNDGMTPQHLIKKEIEIGKRMKYIKKVPSVCDGILHLIRACLQDVPDRRPTTLQSKQELKHLCKNYPNPYGDAIQMLKTIFQL